MNEQSMAAANAENDIKAVIKSYNEAVRGNDAEGFRRAFHPTAPIAQFQQRSGEIDVKTLDGFIEQIDGLHAKFGGAVEVSEDIQVDVSDGIASAHVPFRFQMGDKAFSGVNIFVLAVDGGRWRIMSKVYSL